jgi:di/tricarboxylate transporter
VLSPQSVVRGMTIRDARFRDRFGAVVVAVARGGERVKGNLGSIRLQPGDVLLLEARPAFVSRQRYVKDFLLINDLKIESPRHDKAGLAWIILILLVGAVALGFISMLNAALLGAAAMLLTGCCSVGQAQHSMNVPVLLTIASSFALGTALQTTGAANFLGEQLIGAAGGSTLLMIVLTYTAVTLMTELITNNAAAVIMLPIVLSLAAAAGLPLEPFVITVMIAASASFATPLGYQTNMMVYGPGNYRFSDFLKVGVPMNIWIGIVAVTAIYLHYF